MPELKRISAISVVAISCARARITELFKVIISQHWSRVPTLGPARMRIQTTKDRKKSDHLRRLAMASRQCNIKNDTIQLKKAIKMSICTLLLRTMLYYPLLSRAHDMKCAMLQAPMAGAHGWKRSHRRDRRP